MGDVEPATYPILSQYGSTAVKQLLKTMGLICCLYETDYWNLIKKHRLDAKEIINIKL